MSDGVLNQEQIAALVEAAREGKLPETPAATQRRSQRIRTVDFTRPTKFTNDHQRRITRALETFCQTAATRLSAELRWPFELEVINTTQVTWAAAQAQIPAGSLALTLAVAPIDTKLLFSVELPMVLGAIEALLGGDGDRLPRERRLSEIDWSLTRRVLSTVVHQLSLVWQDLGGLELSIEDIDQHNDASAVASVSEPTYMVLIDCRINRHSTAMALLIPWAAIDPVSDQIAGREAGHGEESLAGTETMARALSTASVTLRAEVAARHLPVEEILSLDVGSLITLGGRAEDGVSLYAENVELGRAQAGAHGRRRAVQILGVPAGGGEG